MSPRVLVAAATAAVALGGLTAPASAQKLVCDTTSSSSACSIICLNVKGELAEITYCLFGKPPAQVNPPVDPFGDAP